MIQNNNKCFSFLNCKKKKAAAREKKSRARFTIKCRWLCGDASFTLCNIVFFCCKSWIILKDRRVKKLNIGNTAISFLQTHTKRVGFFKRRRDTHMSYVYKQPPHHPYTFINIKHVKLQQQKFSLFTSHHTTTTTLMADYRTNIVVKLSPKIISEGIHSTSHFYLSPLSLILRERESHFDLILSFSSFSLLQWANCFFF